MQPPLGGKHPSRRCRLRPGLGLGEDLKPCLNAFPTRKAGCIHSGQLPARAPQSYRAGSLGGLVLALAQVREESWPLTLFSQSHIWPGLDVEMFPQGPCPNQTTLSNAHVGQPLPPPPRPPAARAPLRPGPPPPGPHSAQAPRRPGPRPENCLGFSLWTLAK